MLISPNEMYTPDLTFEIAADIASGTKPTASYERCRLNRKFLVFKWFG